MQINNKINIYYKLFFLVFMCLSLCAEIPIPIRKDQLQADINFLAPFPRRRKLVKPTEEFKTQGDIQVTEMIIHSIRTQLEKCWSIPSVIGDKENFSVKINLLLSPQGEIIMADIMDSDSYKKNSLFRSTADSAMRAVYKCSPLSLPSEHYNIWHEVVLDFILNEKT